MLKRCAGHDEYVVPALLSHAHQHSVDARAYEDISSPCRLTARYDALPPGFFERVIVRSVGWFFVV